MIEYMNLSDHGCMVENQNQHHNQTLGRKSHGYDVMSDVQVDDGRRE
jgi:hypothetical protein